jgi:hypothetical protein
MRDRTSLACAALCLFFALETAAHAANGHPRHELDVALAPATHQITVADVIDWPDGATPPTEFLLSASLKITDATPAVAEVPLGDTSPFFGNNSGSGELDPGRVKRYRFLQAPARTVRLVYSGTINTPLSAQEEEYARGFRDTPGLIGPEGVYLAGATFWYPHFAQGLLTFGMRVRSPEGWQVVSQGQGTSRDEQGVARWTSPDAMDEIYLVGGPLRVYRDIAGAVEAQVYLKGQDDALARKYLDATAQYLEMYRGLIGPYPYSKFAMVENFWETGYGMPSFTLLGPSVLRFPFILTSSYPHEILHNWWGNSVFVDYATGNWCEGLTAYLADHLIQEQRGTGATYRRNALQKYRDYVSSGSGRDFPLTAFRSRHSAATEAVGYGKMLMGAHMLRLQLGDQKFVQFLQRFHREHRGKVAAFGDFRKTAEAVHGQPLGRFFDDWIGRAGAPVLSVGNVSVTRSGDSYVTQGELSQAPAADGQGHYGFSVPLVVQTTGKPVTAAVSVTGASTPFSITSADTPLLLHVDPQFDVFRQLDPRETPPTLSTIFGDPKVTAVLPAGEPEEAARYREMLKAWTSPSQAVEMVGDDQITTLPADRSVWLLGRTNRLAAQVTGRERRFAADGDGWSFAGERLALENHTGVVVVRHPASPSRAVGWIVVAPRAAYPGVARKLPHYGKYSFLGFEGDEPVNTIKGEWSTEDSPTRVDVRPTGMRADAVPMLAMPARKALVDLPPVFSTKALGEHVAYLAAAEREGRGVGTNGLDAAAAYVAAGFEKAGLAPGGPDGYFQPFTIEQGPAGTAVTVKNVIGVLKGTNPKWAQQAVILSAHYDHLGRGWPEARAGEEGKVHPGADDNASGVAVMLELARVLASGEKPQRTIVFAAFTGEEAGLRGARHFIEHPGGTPLAGINAVVNLDTVGRLRNGKVQVLGAGTATEWPHIFRGGSFVTGVETTVIPGNAEASDQRAFIERGIPAVQLFTGPHEDYHRPGDTADKVDVPGLVKVASLAKEAVAYLAERPEPLTVTIARPGTGSGPEASPAGAGGAQGRPAAGRRVTFGAVPDFAYQGSGVRLSGVTSGSPAERAGLTEGDVITRVAGTAVTSLAEFSTVLRGLAAGASVEVVYQRDGAEQKATVTVVER